MGLQLSLLVIGLIIVGLVALTAYDLGRGRRRMRRESLAGLRSSDELTSPPSSSELLSQSAPSPGVRRESRVEPRLDAPAAPIPEVEQKFLSVDDALPEPVIESDDLPDPFHDELNLIEVAASVPLNLNPGFEPDTPIVPPTTIAGVAAIPDEKIDFIIHLPGHGPVGRHMALAIFKQEEFRLENRRQLYGQRHQTNFWSVLQTDPPTCRYSDLKLALQLVDKVAVDESELNQFVQVGLKLADALERPSKFSMPFEQALERAHGLQLFCEEYDVIAGVNVVTDPATPFKGGAIVRAMRESGLEFGAMNIFHKKTSFPGGSRHLFSLSNQFQPGNFDPEGWDDFRTPGITLFMSVPCAPDPVAVFEKMIATANDVAIFLGGRLFDQGQKPLTDTGIAAIRSQISGIDRKMRAFGILPGSETALRLFGAGIVG